MKTKVIVSIVLYAIFAIVLSLALQCGVKNNLKEQQQQDAQDAIKEHRVEVEPIEVFKPIGVQVVATVYNPTAAQCNAEYWITATGAKIDTLNPLKHRWIAISRDLESIFKFGDTVNVSGTEIYDGKWVIQDRMNKRWKHRIDFLIGNEDKIGKWQNIIVSR